MSVRNLWRDRIGRGGTVMALSAVLGILGNCLTAEDGPRWPNSQEVAMLGSMAYGAKEVLEKLPEQKPPTAEGGPKPKPDIPEEPEEPLDAIDLADTADLDEGMDIVFSNLEGNYYFIVQHDTWLKTSIDQADTLGVNDKQRLNAGGEVKIVSYTIEPKSNHLKVQLTDQPDEYFVYEPHIDLRDQSGNPVSTDQASSAPVISGNKTPIRLPGFSKQRYLEDPIIAGGNFTWAEATAGGSRMPTSAAQVANIEKIARVMQDVRVLVGNRPIKITSWLRPPAVNARVGGAPNSKHLFGGAVDFYVIGLTRAEMMDIQRTLEPWALGKGLGFGRGVSSKGFIHIDLGPGRVWGY